MEQWRLSSSKIIVRYDKNRIYKLQLKVTVMVNTEMDLIEG